MRIGPEGEPPEESRFWERYWEAVRRRGVKPGKEKWYERHCARFIRWLKPRRLREAVAKDVTDWLSLVSGQPDTEVWSAAGGQGVASIVSGAAGAELGDLVAVTYP